MDSARHIVHVISTPQGIGGAERIVAQLVTGGDERGWTQTVLNPFGRDSSAAELYAPAQYVHRPLNHPLQLPSMWLWLRRLLRRIAPDVVHAHLYHAMAAVATLPRTREVRVATHHHGGLFRWQGRKWDERVDRWAGRRYDSVVAVSKAVEAHLRAEYGYPTSLLHHIPNGWSGTPVGASDSGRTPIITCVANFRPEKGHTTLLEAFRLVRSSVPDARLRLVGSGPLEASIRTHAGRLHVLEATEFTGSVDNVWPLLATSRVFVLPSFHEPLGLVVMEAMAQGLPVVATRVGGIPELVQDGVTGRLVEAGDVAGLAQAIIELIHTPALCARMGQAAVAAAAPLTAAAMVERYFHLYESLLQTRKS